MGDKVIIGCNLPSGHVLHIEGERIGDGPVPRLASVKLNGTAAARVQDHDGQLGFHPSVSAGYGLTEVDADFWAKWKQQEGENSLLFKSGSIYEQQSFTKAKGEAGERSQDAPATNSLAPLDPEKKGMGKAVPKDVTAADKAA